MLELTLIKLINKTFKKELVMKRKITVLLITFFAIVVCPMLSLSQDLIVKRNGDEILSKVLEITPLEVKYKKPTIRTALFTQS